MRFKPPHKCDLEKLVNVSLDLYIQLPPHSMNHLQCMHIPTAHTGSSGEQVCRWRTGVIVTHGGGGERVWTQMEGRGQEEKAWLQPKAGPGRQSVGTQGEETRRKTVSEIAHTCISPCMTTYIIYNVHVYVYMCMYMLRACTPCIRPRPLQ